MAVAALAAWRIVLAVLEPASRHQSIAAILDGGGDGAPQSGGDRTALPVPDSATVARARALIEQEPLGAQGYAVLALAAGHAGQDGRALALMRRAAAWWPHDLLPQSWLLARSLRDGDPAGAVARLDTIALVRPDTMDAMADALAPMLRDPAFVAVLADRLAGKPAWRGRFLDVALRQWREPAGLAALMDRLQSRPPGLDVAELRPYLRRLRQAGSVDRAYLTWLRSLPDARLGTLGDLYNGSFRDAPSDMPFDWEMPPVPGTATTVGGAADSRVLTVGFFGGRVFDRPVLHDLVLAPGGYRLTGRARTDRLRAERGIRWRLSCVDAPDGLLAASASFTGTVPWHDFAVPFAVPETGCRAQLLALEVDARSSADREVSGVVAFSRLAIERR